MVTPQNLPNPLKERQTKVFLAQVNIPCNDVVITQSVPIDRMYYLHAEHQIHKILYSKLCLRKTLFQALYEAVQGLSQTPSVSSQLSIVSSCWSRSIGNGLVNFETLCYNHITI